MPQARRGHKNELIGDIRVILMSIMLLALLDEMVSLVGHAEMFDFAFFSTSTIFKADLHSSLQ